MVAVVAESRARLSVAMTDRIKAALNEELEHRRGSIDGDGSLNRVTVVVQVDPRSGRVESVTYRPESQRRRSDAS